MATLLVYGWYGRGNAGDELMARALRMLFAHHAIDLKFCDVILEADVRASAGVVFGGGCILYDAPGLSPGAHEMLLRKERPCFYLGIGTETAVHDRHKELLKVARVVATRSLNVPEWLKSEKVISVPDLVYSLVDSARATYLEPCNGVLVVPNVETVPSWSDPHWMHIGWERFKDEFAQFLDWCVEEGMEPDFLLMCRNPRVDDGWAAQELVARMKNRSTQFRMLRASTDLAIISDVIERYEVMVTQRYHGIVVAQACGLPCVSIDHHDKLKHAWPRIGTNLPYHGVTKDALIREVSAARASTRQVFSVPKESYESLARIVSESIHV